LQAEGVASKGEEAEFKLLESTFAGILLFSNLKSTDVESLNKFFGGGEAGSVAAVLPTVDKACQLTQAC
jgi:hypothetical protein